MEKEALDNYLKAGRIAAEALEYGAGLVKPSTSVLEVARKVEAKIFALGAEPAFPVNISFNETAAHYTPIPDDKTLFDNQVVKLDVGVHFQGCVGGDTARTIDLSGKYSDLCKASEEALKAAIKTCQIGVPLRNIGKEIESTILSFGFKPVRNLSGHGIGDWTVHDSPSIPNYDNGDETLLEDGMTIAIEPFATAGAGMIEEKGIPYIHSIVGRKPVRSQMSREVLSKVAGYNGLPFATRWLTDALPAIKVNFALKEFNQLGILHSYAPLVDKDKGIVSQAEHSLYIGDKIIVMTRL